MTEEAPDPPHTTVGFKSLKGLNVHERSTPMASNSSTNLLGKLTDTLASLLPTGRQTHDPEQVVTVVSGLPRSGTSMMMNMLEKGGIDPLTDHEREPDEDNPEGYYEFERVKKLDEGDTAWVPQARGKAVKVISALLKHLPDDQTYRVIFMRRKLDEVLESQRKMLERRGEDPDKASEEELKELFMQHLGHVESWAENASNVEFIYASYNDIVRDPERQAERIESFLERDLDTRAMARVVDPDLYRNRA